MDFPLGASALPLYLAHLQKPLVFHNGMLDIMYLYDKFYEDLPDNVNFFKAKINAMHPWIYDTKYKINNLANNEKDSESRVYDLEISK